MEHPIQPVETDKSGVARFKSNAIVRHLLSHASNRGCDVNDLACMDFPNEDWEQFSQLTGYSVSGYSELSYVRKETIEAVDIMANNPSLASDDARKLALETILADARATVAKLVEVLGVSED